MTYITAPDPGKIFGRLTVLERMGGYCKCTCTCGTTKLIRTDRLKSGKTRSCGCLAKELSEAARKPKPPTPKPRKRTADENRLAAVWSAMVQRCTNPNDKSYRFYGGRGIVVDPTWLNFHQFYFEMASRYRHGLWLERLDNSGPYCFDNCTFRSPNKQARNRANTLRFADGGLMVDCREGTYHQKYVAFQRCIRKLGCTPTQQEWRLELRHGT